MKQDYIATLSKREPVPTVFVPGYCLNIRFTCSEEGYIIGIDEDGDITITHESEDRVYGGGTVGANWSDAVWGCLQAVITVSTFVLPAPHLPARTLSP